MLTKQERETILLIAASGGAVEESKFYEASQELVVGQREAAALGLDALLMPGEQEPLTKLGSLIAGGIEAIQLEVDEFAKSKLDTVKREQDTVWNWLHYIRKESTSEKQFSNGTRDKGQVGKISWSTQTLKRQS